MRYDVRMKVCAFDSNGNIFPRKNKQIFSFEKSSGKQTSNRQRTNILLVFQPAKLSRQLLDETTDEDRFQHSCQ